MRFGDGGLRPIPVSFSLRSAVVGETPTTTRETRMLPVVVVALDPALTACNGTVGSGIMQSAFLVGKAQRKSPAPAKAVSPRQGCSLPLCHRAHAALAELALDEILRQVRLEIRDTGRGPGGG